MVGSKSDLVLRPVTAADAQLLYAWRNDPETRRASRQDDVVKWRDHEAWLSDVLASHLHVMRLAEVVGRPVGVVRADRIDDRWELSWTIAPDARGQGFGRRMLTKFVAGLDGPLGATIRNDNVASAKMAAAAGFSCSGPAFDAEFEIWERGR